MAKQVSAIQVSGKLGNTVGMKGADGQTYMRLHVNPKNPKTELQVVTRGKMALAGMLSSLIPAELIVGLNGGNKRARRQRLVKRMISAMTNDNTGAVLAPEGLVFSEGRGVNIPTPTVTFAENALTVTMAADTFTEEMPTVIVVAVFSDNEGGNFHRVDAVATTRTTASAGFIATDKVANIYLIPVLLDKTVDNNVNYLDVIEAVDIENNKGYGNGWVYLANSGLKYGASQFVRTIEGE